MKERHILFNAQMVRALLDGSKTQTRRVVKPQFGREPTDVVDGVPSWDRPTNYDGEVQMNTQHGKPCPYGHPGDRLWVRETFFAWGRWETRYSEKKGRDEWHFIDMTLECEQYYLYAADGVSDTRAFIKRRSDRVPMYWKRPAIFMPRAANRILLDITDVRVERLQDMDGQTAFESDALKEGINAIHHGDGDYYYSAFRDEPHPKNWCDPADAFRELWESINGAGSWNANPWAWVVEFRKIT